MPHLISYNSNKCNGCGECRAVSPSNWRIIYQFDPRYPEKGMIGVKDELVDDLRYDGEAQDHCPKYCIKIQRTKLKNDTTIDQLIETLKSEDPRMRREAVLFLGRKRGLKVSTALRRALNDENLAVRLSAVKALRNFKEKRVIDAIAKTLIKSTDRNLKVEALESLKHIDDNRAVPHLCRLLKQIHDTFLRTTLEVLSELPIADRYKHLLTENPKNGLNPAFLITSLLIVNACEDCDAGLALRKKKTNADPNVFLYTHIVDAIHSIGNEGGEGYMPPFMCDTICDYIMSDPDSVVVGAKDGIYPGSRHSIN